MGGRKKEEAREKKLRWFRPELDHFSKHLSLIVFKYSLKTLRELLQKQKEIVFKISPFTHHSKPHNFQMHYCWVRVQFKHVFEMATESTSI